MFRAPCPVLLMALILSSCDSPTSPTGSDPVLATISPTSTVAGSSDVTLSVTGIHFDDAAHHRSQVIWEANGNNTPLTTTFVSRTQLTAVVPAALLSSFTIARVFVQTGDPVSDAARSTSNAVGFRVDASHVVWPAIAISPTAAVAGGPDLKLTIIGSRFVAAPHQRSQVIWVANSHRTLLATSFQSSTQLTATISPALLTGPVNALVFVETEDPMGDAPLSTSDSVVFTVSSSPGEGAGAILVYGQTTTLPPKMKGSRQISLDGSPWELLLEGHSLMYNPEAAGAHRLIMSNPCTGNHQPSFEDVNVVAGDTIVVTVLYLRTASSGERVSLGTHRC